MLGALTWWYVTVTAAHLFRGWGDWVILLAVIVAVFYVVVFWVGPRMVANRRWRESRMAKWGMLIIIVMMALLIAVSWSLGALTIAPAEKTQPHPRIRNLVEVLSLLAVVVMVAFALFAKSWGADQYVARVANEMKLRGMEAKLRKAKQSWVQQDFPPHLLFNSLSVARALTRRDPERAREAMTLIGNLAKYYVKKCKSPEVPLAAELEQLASLQRLYALRYDGLALDIRVPDQVAQLKIIPMLLVVLLENMAKYGVLADPRRPARLLITQEGEQTAVLASNFVKGDPEPGGLGIAIDSLRKQLALRYPKGSGVTATQSAGQFTIRLFYTG